MDEVQKYNSFNTHVVLLKDDSFFFGLVTKHMKFVKHLNVASCIDRFPFFQVDQYEMLVTIFMPYSP
jgi:hypothetical protein